LILLFLSRVKAKKKKASFKEVLTGIIEKKKEDMQKARKMRQVPGLTQAELEKVENGFTKAQAEEILDLINKVREKYTKNNESMIVIQE
jgi:flagellar hook-basal body complex protein FliE